MTEIDIDLRGQPGDIRYECPICHWGVTLRPSGAALWTKDGSIVPRCRKDNVELTRTEIGPRGGMEGAPRS